jgi:hypothetical protein
LTKVPKTYIGKSPAFSTNDTRKLDTHKQNNEIRSLSLTIYTNHFKIDHKLKCKTPKYELLEESRGNGSGH